MKEQIDGKRVKELRDDLCAIFDSEWEERRIISPSYTALILHRKGYRKQSEWISVDERLPGVSGRYICAVKDKNGHTWTVAGDYSLEMKKWFGLLFGEIKNTVTHWMPLPEPPKMKGGAE